MIPAGKPFSTRTHRLPFPALHACRRNGKETQIWVTAAQFCSRRRCRSSPSAVRRAFRCRRRLSTDRCSRLSFFGEGAKKRTKNRRAVELCSSTGRWVEHGCKERVSLRRTRWERKGWAAVTKLHHPPDSQVAEPPLLSRSSFRADARNPTKSLCRVLNYLAASPQESFMAGPKHSGKVGW